ncbi:MAG: bifunctional adenosylcobinamide kinase/adenosylcobinamide-phosphate guanylyltransferase [Actinomycetota bacterium]|nr:bifunctional adenosylcobinamide kinase/adenosylcobinamide-phosphate guanylyltransferase [Actinomycetota bacterium]MDG2121098.1 bifunctional adenosylcobinamide kinase/adenosylcobinamide-phosphate guanylyltransferase [Actinomycetota bacterium]
MTREPLSLSCPEGLTFLTGGARSGKSRVAQEIASGSESPVCFLATAEALDDDMASRIAQHQNDRPFDWLTKEAPIEINKELLNIDKNHVVIIDCLTLWVSNLLSAKFSPDEIFRKSSEVITTIGNRSAGTIVVSNEVGLGIVPGNELSRAYRDVLGSVNQLFACNSDQSFLIVAGLFLPLQDPERVL